MHEIIFTCSILLNFLFFINWFHRITKKGEAQAMYDLNDLSEKDNIIITLSGEHIKVKVIKNNSNLQTIAIKSLQAEHDHVDGVYSYHSKIFANRWILTTD